MTDLQDKVALISGGARRIGAAITRALHHSGMRVVIQYRNSAQDAEALRDALCAQRPSSAIAVRADVSQVADVRALVERAVAEFGRLDALVNNAAAFFATPLETADEAQWQTLMDTNLKAPFFLAQAAAPHLRARGGAIVNITDIYATRPLADHPIYCAAKAGLGSLTRSLAVALGPQVRVNAVAPGAILWPAHSADDDAEQRRLVARTPLMRVGGAEDLAAVVRFLLTDGEFISGQEIAVDGGRNVVD